MTGMTDTSIEASGRSCGDCSLCCKLLRIDKDGLNKPANQWCQHCKPGKGGCGIYETRPGVCRGFACLWLIDPNIREHWRPLHSKMVLHQVKNSKVGGLPTCTIVVDPAVSNRWREEPFYSQIKNMAAEGAYERKFSTRVVVGRRAWVITDFGEFESDAEDAFVISAISRRVLFFKSWEEASAFTAKVAAIGKQMYDCGSSQQAIFDRIMELEEARQAADLA